MIPIRARQNVPSANVRHNQVNEKQKAKELFNGGKKLIKKHVRLFILLDYIIGFIHRMMKVFIVFKMRLV